MPDELFWITPGNFILPLVNGDGIDTEWDIEGRLALSFAVEEEPNAADHGSRAISARAVPRSVALKTVVFGATEAELKYAIETYADAFTPTLGPQGAPAPGRLRSVREDGTIRDLHCFVDFVVGAESPANGVLAHQLPALLRIRALDPFWYDTVELARQWEPGGPAGLWFPWEFPIPLASSAVFAQDGIDNETPFAAWPIWTITGPGNGLVLRDMTTGQWLSLDYTLAAGEVVSMDFRFPGQKTVRNHEGTSLWGLVQGRPWPFWRGWTSLQIEYAGADLEAGSKIHVAVLRRRHSP